MGNLRLAQVPDEHLNKLFANLVKHRGVEGAKQLVQANSLLSASFPWCLSNEGHYFWEQIENGENPKVTITTNTVSSELEELVKKAEAIGFAVGVETKFGIIREFNSDGTAFEHELCDDGGFFYHNIRVLNAKGKWCKPNKKEKSGQSSDAYAIHAILDEIFKFRK
jgi:hypothetical protein